VRWVINTGGHDHRGLGNSCFQALGAELITHAGGEADMRNRGNDHLQSLQAVLCDKAPGTVPTLPTRWIGRSAERLELGGVDLEFKHRGGAHTLGEMMVWLPASRVLFSGDVVHVERMLGVIAVSHTMHRLACFAVIESLA
jgi:glyoxylase-like metal-dependent hydrolase (beta-lactamase superfamily II)